LGLRETIGIHPRKTAGDNRLAFPVTKDRIYMASTATPTRDDFAALLDKSLGESQSFEGKVVKGRVTAIENDLVVIDVGLKSEGRISIREFTPPGQAPQVSVGDDVDVYVDRVENAFGEAMLSRKPSSTPASAWTAPSSVA
jgi:small subunit ribosomal protein S1